MALEKYVSDRRLAYFKSKIDALWKVKNVKVNGTAVTPDANGVADMKFDHIKFKDDNVGGYGIEFHASDAAYVGDHIGIRWGSDANPTDGFELYRQNDYPFTVQIPSKSYVDNNAGKIDKIKVNGTEQTITNKEVDLKVAEIYSEEMGDTGKADSIEISTKSCGFHINKYLTVSLLGANGSLDHQFTLVDRSYADATYRTEAQVEAAIAAAQTGAFVKVASYDDLPSEGAAGKIYLVPNSGSGQNVYDEYIWCVVAMMAGGGGGESPVYGYEKIGTTAVDLTGYVQESDLVEITEAEIDAMFT